MSARTEIAEAADAVEGISATPYVSGSTDPGTVYLRLNRIDYPNPFGGVVTWDVCLVLPQDIGEAEQYLETNLPALREAIEPHLVIKSVTPQRLQLEGIGVLPVAFITGTREED